MNRTQKEQLVKNLSEMLKTSESLVIADFTGMTVAQADDLRAKFDEAGTAYQVVKNTLLKRAVQDTDMSIIEPLCEGPSAIGLGSEDPAAPARLMGSFIKENPKSLKVKGGFLSGKLLDAAGVTALAKMPTLVELRSQLLGVIQAPAQKLASQLNAPLQQLVGVNQARIDEQKD